MPVVKLTLSAEKDLVAEAKTFAARRKTSVSAMVSGFLRSLSRLEGGPAASLGPITRRASGIVKLPPGRSDKDLVADALVAKYERPR
jgi:hypothetical protein